MKELARRLLLSIRCRPGPGRPILFIASCLGGIILAQAMVIAADPSSDYNSLWQATGGIVFLATPFRGTAFQDIARIAGVALKARAGFSNTAVSDHLQLAEKVPFLEELVASFTQICQQNRAGRERNERKEKEKK